MLHGGGSGRRSTAYDGDVRYSSFGDSGSVRSLRSVVYHGGGTGRRCLNRTGDVRSSSSFIRRHSARRIVHHGGGTWRRGAINSVDDVSFEAERLSVPVPVVFLYLANSGALLGSIEIAFLHACI